MNPPLCCIAPESPDIGASSPRVSNPRSRSTATSSLHISDEPGSNSRRPQTTVAGVIYKWTSYRKGWRSRWFLLRSGVVTYSKIRPSDCLNQIPLNCDVRLIGDISVRKLSKLDRASCSPKSQKTVRVVQLKISSFRESKSDERRFYIFTATKTLQLRTASIADRVAWIQALVSSRSQFLPRSVKVSDFSLPDAAASTEKLKKRLIAAGIDENVVKDCEQIMLAEFSEIRGHLEALSVEKSNLLGTLRQLKASTLEAEALGVLSRNCSLSRHEFTGIVHRKYSESSTSTATPSDDVEKQESEETSDEDETYFFDTKDYFSEPTFDPENIARGMHDVNQETAISDHCRNVEKMHTDKGAATDVTNLGFERRKKLPDPVEKEKGISLWSLIKDNVGKDLTRVCLPVYFNEPISSLQKCFEDFEYSNLLDQAYEHGKAGNSLLRALKVAAFAVSGYASTKGRPCKPFNPLLGETYEANFPEKGVRFFSEKVSHHPTVIACHCEGNGWKLWADSNLRTKFWGQSIQLDPVGVLTLEFDDGEIFQWNKITTTLNNLILGKVYVDHHGTMHIKGNREFSSKIKFKEPFIFERNPHQIRGFVEDSSGKKVATLFGKWDESVYYLSNEEGGMSKTSSSTDASLLWKSSKPASEPTRYNLTSFAITLNELTPGLQELLPPTDSRLRPDQRHLENGEYEKANAEKQRLEKRQRMSKKLQESGWKARWFERDGGNGAFRYGGGYWEAREQARWEGCPNIFGEFNEEEEEASLVVSSTN